MKDGYCQKIGVIIDHDWIFYSAGIISASIASSIYLGISRIVVVVVFFI